MQYEKCPRETKLGSGSGYLKVILRAEATGHNMLSVFEARKLPTSEYKSILDYDKVIASLRSNGIRQQHATFAQKPEDMSRRGHVPFRVLGHQNTAISALSRSVISIEAGLCVMQNGTPARSSATCEVTPQAQNTGTSRGHMGTTSPPYSTRLRS